MLLLTAARPSCPVAAGFSKDEASLYRYRCVELKHGRVAMLAILGQLVQINTHLPDAVFSNPRPLGALGQLLAERPLAIVQIVLAIAALELTAGAQDVENNAPGQIGRYVHISTHSYRVIVYLGHPVCLIAIAFCSE
jgi:hypothetical protein